MPLFKVDKYNLYNDTTPVKPSLCNTESLYEFSAEEVIVLIKKLWTINLYNNRSPFLVFHFTSADTFEQIVFKCHIITMIMTTAVTTHKQKVVTQGPLLYIIVF